MKMMTRRLTAWAVLLFALTALAGCSTEGTKDVWAEEGETVHTGLFDFTVSGVSVVESYGSLETEEGSRLVRMDLTVTNTSNEAYLMFSQDFQLQWGDGTEDFGTCLPAVDEEMTPYAYTLEPGESYESVMVAQIPEGADKLTIAYQEKLSSGEDGSAYFVEADL